MASDLIQVPASIAQAWRMASPHQRERAERALAEILQTSATRPEEGSVYDMLEDVIGSLDGPGNISYNRAYLDDLGASSQT